VTVNHIIDQYIAHLSSQESNLARKSVAAEVKISSLRTSVADPDPDPFVRGLDSDPDPSIIE
jgi:hypothetical protein